MEKVARPSVLTPDSIVAKLFSLHARAHYFHLQTTSYAMHKNLNKLYQALEDSKDAIAEYLLGVQAPKRFGTIAIEPPGVYSESAVTQLLNEGFDFTVSLCQYADLKGYEQLCNLASDLQGSFVSSKYFATLK